MGTPVGRAGLWTESGDRHWRAEWKTRLKWVLPYEGHRKNEAWGKYRGGCNRSHGDEHVLEKYFHQNMV